MYLHYYMQKRSQKCGGQQHVKYNVRQKRAVLCREPKAQLNLVLTRDNALKPHFYTAPIVVGCIGFSKSNDIGQWHETKEMGCVSCHWLNWHVVMVRQQSWPLRTEQHVRTENLTSKSKYRLVTTTSQHCITSQAIVLCSPSWVVPFQPKIKIHKEHLMRIT